MDSKLFWFSFKLGLFYTLGSKVRLLIPRLDTSPLIDWLILLIPSLFLSHTICGLFLVNYLLHHVFISCIQYIMIHSQPTYSTRMESQSQSSQSHGSKGESPGTDNGNHNGDDWNLQPEPTGLESLEESTTHLLDHSERAHIKNGPERPANHSDMRSPRPSSPSPSSPLASPHLPSSPLASPSFHTPLSPIHSPTLQSDDTSDPLELHKLALSYDYLIYKINDHIATLSETTHQSILRKQHLISNDYLQDQLHLTDELKEIDDIMAQCKTLELEFLKLDQLNGFITQFKERVAELERIFA